MNRLFKTALSVLLAGAVLATGVTPSTANTDTDGDGLFDVWETDGLDVDGDGTIDLDFPAWGADPLHKDLFVEMDYMPGLLPPENELDEIVEIFANFPVDNPDERRGITIHLDAGDARSAKYNLGGGNEMPLKPFAGGGEALSQRGANSSPLRNGIFHYMVWGDRYDDTGSSGLAYISGLDFVVTVGPTFWGRASREARVGTFVHELGHNLGLNHGGRDGTNYKPNYLSVMNYRYQLAGVVMADNSRYFGYSTRHHGVLDENSLMEANGTGAASDGYLFSFNTGGRRSIFGPGAGPADFNGDGAISPDPVAVDLNNDGKLGVLDSFNDMAQIRFQVRHGHGRSKRDVPEIIEEEMTPDLARRLQAETEEGLQHGHTHPHSHGHGPGHSHEHGDAH